MGTPTFVRFSRIQGKPFRVLGELEQSSRFKGGALREIVKLKTSDDPEDGGLALDGKFIPCSSLRQAQDIAEDWDCFALVWLDRAAIAEYYLYIFDAQQDSFACSMAFESSLAYHRTDESPSGARLEQLIFAITTCLDASVSGYGLDSAYEVQHQPLSSEEVLGRLRSGELLSLPRPIFHLISTKLVSVEEVRALIREHNASPDPEHRVMGRYHALGRVGL